MEFINIDEAVLQGINFDVADAALRSNEEITKVINEVMDDNGWEFEDYTREEIIARAIEIARETPVSWRDLAVSDSDSNASDTLGEFVRTCPENLDNATIEGGEITAWPGFLLSAPGEAPDWDTPRVPVDWDGFEEALGVHDDEPEYPWLSIEQYVLANMA